MRKKLLITAAAIIISAGSITGGTMAVYRAATHTDKTISTSSIGVSLNIDESSKEKIKGNISMGQRVEQRVSARNTGSRPQYVRVKVDKEWLREDKEVDSCDGEELNKDYIGIDYINTEDWIYAAPAQNIYGAADEEDKKTYEEETDNTGYLYYKKIVQPGESTSDFMEAYTILDGVDANTNIYRDLSVKVDYSADAIQTVAVRPAMLYEWGVLADIADNGEIKSIKYPKAQETYELTEYTDNTDNILENAAAQVTAMAQDNATAQDNAMAQDNAATTAIILENAASGFGVVEKDIDYLNMEPGEMREGKVSLYNNSDKDMKFYISSELIKNIADEGAGTGKYNIWIYKQMENNEYSLLYDGTIGSDDTSYDNMLIKDQYLTTLSSKEGTAIKIVISLDGKTMDNSYMNKQGCLRINISAQEAEKETSTRNTVKTGDNSLIMVYGVLAIIAGVACIGTISGMYAGRKRRNNVVNKDI